MTRETNELRKYPPCPRLGVGVLVTDKDRFLLVKRGQAPAQGEWSVPGGLVELGETVKEAAARELYEECGIVATIEQVLFEVFEYIKNDDNGDVMYHFVVIDMLARYESGTLRAQSDAQEARWFTLEELNTISCSEKIKTLVKRAF